MNRLWISSFITLWIGTTLLLSCTRRFSRRSLAFRLRPYVLDAPARAGHEGLLSVESFAEVLGPLAVAVGERVSRLFGVSEALGARLARIHAPLDASGFRVRQLGWATVAFGAGSAVALAVTAPPPVAILLVLGAPLLTFLALEQQVAAASAAWQRRVVLELPVMCEQLAMLVTAGYSLGSALDRLAQRGSGACARDLSGVVSRVRQGVSESTALREWADRARVPALDRLVSILALNGEASDLGRLVSVEARTIRADCHRQVVATLERRAEQVWVPVTLATLVPGVIFLAIPFIQALRIFSGS